MAIRAKDVRATDYSYRPRRTDSTTQRYALRLLDLNGHASTNEHLGEVFDPIYGHNPASLRSELQVARVQQDAARVIRLHTLIATAEGRYDFTLSDTSRSLNHLFPDVRLKTFQEWFVEKWELSP